MFRFATGILKRQGLTTTVKRNISSEFAYNLSGFNQYGLMRDDLLDDTDPDVKEALKRLPPDELNCRNYRILRAMQLSLCHDILPKEEWTKYEEDDLYLTPIIKEVMEERKERETWDAKY